LGASHSHVCARARRCFTWATGPARGRSSRRRSSSRTSRRLPGICSSSSTACCWQVPEEGAEALTLIEGAETLFDPRWVCPLCPTGYHLAAATVCARAGQLARGHAFLERAEFGAGRWPGGPWPAAVARARAELLLADGDHHAAADALRRAAEGYAPAGQLLNERRAREALERIDGATVRV